ncbi:unnamed protein product [Prorocentrum cordatum]|uniref:Uncharacterized protein n=1 Tax=Prorocentrum cordatum TaxID=2364126 RepID=A0ABN9Y2J4_9DINO|nr:unnamed protein product [Polarella glacialis]
MCVSARVCAWTWLFLLSWRCSTVPPLLSRRHRCMCLLVHRFFIPACLLPPPGLAMPLPLNLLPSTPLVSLHLLLSRFTCVASPLHEMLTAPLQEGNPVVSANPLMSIFSSFGAMGAKLGKQLRRLVAGTPRPTSMMLGSIVGKQLRSLVGNPKYYPGSEPYAMDYGCAKGPVSKAFDGIQPGKRWWNSPKYGTVIVTTPCPCALGAWTGMQTGPQARPPASHAEDRTFESPDKAQEVPAWQQPQSMSLSSCAAASPEAAGTFALGVPCRAGAARCGSGARRGSRGGTAPGPGGPRRRRAAAFL